MHIKKHFTIERSVHVVMVVFAMASVSNVASFFMATDHHQLVALLVALALGTAVATSAIMLTMIDMEKQRGRYVAVGTMVLALVGVSGFVQTQNYLAHDLSLLVAATMGFGIVFAGEVLTAIGLSLYQAAERQRLIDEADSGLELKLVQTFAETMNAIDTTSSAKYLQKHIDRIIKHKADQLVAKYVPPQVEFNHEPSRKIKGTNTNVPEPKIKAQTAINHQNCGFGPQNLPEANEARSEEIRNRRDVIIGMLEIGKPMKRAEIESRLSELNMSVGPDTLRSDLEAVGAARDGHRYSFAKA